MVKKNKAELRVNCILVVYEEGERNMTVDDTVYSKVLAVIQSLMCTKIMASND